jgi:UDP-galactopyranose mutase
VKGRVPKDTGRRSSYFPGQFQGIPEHGYTAMLTGMLDGADVRLGVDRQAWKMIRAGRVVYCGRFDLIDDDIVPVGWRSVDFVHGQDVSALRAPVRNFCHLGTPFTRVTNMGLLMPGGCGVPYGVAEVPRAAGATELAPFYPVPTEANLKAAAAIRRGVIADRYPGLILAGRLGNYAYFDMHAAVSAALKIAETL